MAETVHFVSLGCPKNLVDSEIMLGNMLKSKYVATDNPTDADVIVVNTCSFIASATQESVDTILEMAQYKTEGKCNSLIVTGCLAQRHGEEVSKELSEVDYFVGTGEYNKITDILATKPSQRTFIGVPTYIHDEYTPRTQSTAFYTSYLKISEGCRHRCSFCIIPTLRGDLRSRSIESITNEAKFLAEKGVVELNIISQDTNSFGFDRVGAKQRGMELARLLKELTKIDGIEWIRLLYLYPKGFPEELIEVIASEPKIVKYIDMPLQHISTSVLSKMNRGVGEDRCRKLVRSIRDKIPNVVMRTTFITGFPGETDVDFQSLYSFVEEMRFERMGVFTYSPENGTPAADLPNQVPEKIKKSRQNALMKLQKKISKEHYKSLVGTVQDVLIEGISDETDLLMQGRLSSQAPDIDGHILISAGSASVGSIVPVKMQRALDYGMVGEILENYAENRLGDKLSKKSYVDKNKSSNKRNKTQEVSIETNMLEESENNFQV